MLQQNGNESQVFLSRPKPSFKLSNGKFVDRIEPTITIPRKFKPHVIALKNEKAILGNWVCNDWHVSLSTNQKSVSNCIIQ
jgi:hypothetical protein